MLLSLPLLPAKPHSFLFLAGAAGNSTREDKNEMCDEHDTSEQYYLQRSTKLCGRNPHQRQQNNRSKSYSNKPTSPPLVNGHTNYFSLTGNDFYENGHEDNDGVEEDKNSSQSSRVLVDSVAHADYSYDKDIGNSDDAVGESNGSEKKDGHCILNGDSSKDAECQTGGVNQLGDRHGHDVDGNDDANIGNGNADHDDDNDGANAASTVKNDDDSDENGDNGCNGYHNLHHLHHARYEHSDGGGGKGNTVRSGDRDNDKDRGNHGEFNRNSNFDYENKNDDAESEDVVAKSSSLPVERLVPGKSFKDFKLATKDTKLSLPVNAGLDDQVKSRTIGTTAGDNNGNKKPPGARAKTLLTSNEYTAKVLTTSYPPSLGSKTSSLRLPRVNGVELNYFYNSRIPSLDATGINQNFLARHTIDQSLQHASQPSDFKLTRELTPPTDWPVWSLPPPPMTGTTDLRHRWPQSSGLHPSVVSYQTGRQSSWNDEPPASRLPTVKSYTPKTTATVTELQPSASVTSWSVPSYSYQSSVVPENGHERFLEPSIPNSCTENREHVHPVTSSEISPLRREDQGNGASALSPEFLDDPSLAALERKVAEACAVVERVMKEREERTKAQREAARKKREIREQREKEAREMREREKRERREREEREREERKMRERQEREIKEREERDRREQIENEGRDTRWFGGERAPVQESPRWQCEHYQRRCLVKFPCCGIFYPCHRCHNSSGACDTDDRKANNATHVKCGICGHEEEVSGFFVLAVIPMNCFAHSCCA